MENNGDTIGCPQAEAHEKCASSWGGKLAEDAIADITKEKCAEKACEGKSLMADVQAFLKKCEESKSNPMDIVERIAKKEGIDLEDEAPKDVDKRKVYMLIREVIKSLFLTSLHILIDKYGMNIADILEMVGGSLSDLAERYGDRDKELSPEISAKFW